MENKIRVLAVVRKLVPGGIENRLMDIIRNIDKSRIIIDVFTCYPEEGLYDEEVRCFGGRVYYNPELNIKNMIWYVRYFRDFLLEHQEYKIVHAHQDAWCSVFCKGAYLAGVPVRIAHSRTAISTHSLGNMVKDIIKVPIRKYANYFFAVSGKAGRWLYGERLYKTGRVQIWPNAIDASKFYYDELVRKTVRDTNGWENKYVVMHVGNFTPPKNHPFILDVFNELYALDRDAILILVGAGDHTYMNEYIKEHDLKECVHLLGRRTDVNQLLQGADVFLFPSIFEGLPGALIEAQASGLPCVMSDTIAEEVQICPQLTVLSLEENSRVWAESIRQYKDFIRLDTRAFIEEKGFDIHSLTDKLCQFYEEAYEEGEKENGFVRKTR